MLMKKLSTHCLVLVTLAVSTSVSCNNQFSRQNSHPPFSRQKSSAFSRQNEDRQAQAPSYATHNFEPLYRAKDRSEGEKKKGRRPNIILILTDDQDVELGSLQFMPKLAKYMSQEGATFSNGFVSTPMCCPSRSSLLTGLYVHNHAVYTNNDNCSSTFWVQEHEPRTYATYLQDSGYSTAYFGKYLNKYTGNHVPAGWGEWQGLIRNSRFYNYTLNVNGALHHHGFNYEKDYLPDIVTNRSMNFLRWSLTTSPETPVLATLSYPGPHGPEDSAPQYQHLFHNVTTHHTPAYDLAPNPDKQWILRETGKMAPIQRRFTDVLMTKRLQTLQSIDDGVEKIVKLLEELGEIDNTYIFYTSDHGYHLGQYGLVKGKAFPFDVDTKVPLIVRGPGIPRNTNYPQPVVNIDLAPTFLDAGGLEAPPHMDGRSMLNIFRNNDDTKESDDLESETEVEGDEGHEMPSWWKDAFLIERGKMTFERYMKVSALANNTLFLKNRLTKRERVEIECKKPRYQLPCDPGQKWFCKERKTDGVVKMRRCPTPTQKQDSCNCRAGELVGWRYSKLEPRERNHQKDFLRKHVSHADKIKPKFLKTLRSSGSHHHDLKDDLEDVNGDLLLPGEGDVTSSSVSRRWTRSAATNNIVDRWRRMAALEEQQDDSSLEGILLDVADQELLEVDGMVEDLTAELRDLHKITKDQEKESEDLALSSAVGNIGSLHNVTRDHLNEALEETADAIAADYDDADIADNQVADATSVSRDDNNCLLNRNNVLCSSGQDLTRAELSWEESRLAVKHQIQRLRAQLHELKQIRRYLHVRRPHHKKHHHHHRKLSLSSPRGDRKLTGSRDRKLTSRGHLRSMVNGGGGALGHSLSPHDLEGTGAEPCTCSTDPQDADAFAEKFAAARQQRRREKKLEKLRRKAAKREKLERKLARKLNPKKADHCKADVKMNCFSHDNNHWKTPPLWTEGPFCACTNSNNNTYWCVRNINSTHNYLYCEYVTGMVTYFDLRVDPHQLRNLLHTLTDDEINFMHFQVTFLREYSAAKEHRRQQRAHLPTSPSLSSSPSLSPFLSDPSPLDEDYPWMTAAGDGGVVDSGRNGANVEKNGGKPERNGANSGIARRRMMRAKKKQMKKLKKQQQLEKRIQNLLLKQGDVTSGNTAAVLRDKVARNLQRRLALRSERRRAKHNQRRKGTRELKHF